MHANCKILRFRLFVRNQYTPCATWGRGFFFHNINDCIRVVTHNSRYQSWLKSETELSNLSTSIVNRNNWFSDTVVFVGIFSPSPERKTNDNETLFPVKFELLVNQPWLTAIYIQLVVIFVRVFDKNDGMFAAKVDTRYFWILYVGDVTFTYHIGENPFT